MSKSKRTIKAIFEVAEDSDLAGIHFKVGNKSIDWGELTRMEQIHILNAWAGHYQLFAKFLKPNTQ